MSNLERLIPAMIVAAGLAACGETPSSDSTPGQGTRTEQTMERTAGEPSGMAQQAMDAAQSLVGDELSGTVSEMTDSATEQAREIAGDAVDQARDMAEEAANEVMDDPEAAEALKKRF